MLAHVQSSGLSVEVCGEELLLLPDKAAFWASSETLLVADAHFGKAASFRAARIPVPGGTTEHACARLSRLLTETEAKRLIFLGDMWHAKEGRAPKTLETILQWRKQWAPVEMILVEGNHDRRAGVLPPELEIREVQEPFAVGPFAMCHYPETPSEAYVLSGHVHPCVHLSGKGSQSLRIPCFYFGRRCAILPAFGEFTGCAEVRPKPNDLIFAVADGRILPVRAR